MILKHPYLVLFLCLVYHLAMFSNIGTTEIVVIVIVLIILFGGNKLSEIAKGLGEATREVRKAQKEVDEVKEVIGKKLKVKNKKNA